MSKKNKDSLFMRIFYAGVGLGAITIEKLEKSLSKLVSDSQISLDEFKDNLNKIVKDLAAKKEDVQKQLEQYIENSIENFKFAKADQLKQLEQKLEQLEKAVEKLEKALDNKKS